MPLINVEQGTPEWFAVRKGLDITASIAPSAAGIKGAYESRAACYRSLVEDEERS